ncbi:capsular polysaccharide biosynthesis protein [Comamonas thiooxydans]|uniref:HAD-IIIC family phosphatase n=2 Tax=Comamonadaceae TaxID=80864 RepID=UPI00050EF4F8|nr:HAD-IIIC family phosphatase [Comamonas sp.]KGG83407.1 capsular polysaccharide biosynthesis protein [Comamonas thiooxydans]KGG96104.1 capsular polysaccharide biosynthesis protein [Comamonas thiooxydans]KGH02538.1 capsular polysaccharide biosynthesis protein [Comamonas thiooxydans]KGH07569.1 capsular polysaccharide biosynthesis protein [Comamonas thiooxydans]MPS95319.1 HAD-IIIC family phosphatase [Comamonas sp.]
MKRIVMDLDETICSTVNGDYANSIPKPDVIERMREFKAQGFEIVISTSRNMRTYEGNVGKINANTLPIIVGWLDKHKVPYDEIYTGKPWCGTDGFYVDDRALRPDEFVQLSVEDIRKLVGIKR